MHAFSRLLRVPSLLPARAWLLFVHKGSRGGSRRVKGRLMLYQHHHAKSGTSAGREVLLNLLFALILDLVLVAAVKGLVKRRRPVYNKMDMFATVSVDKYSFPSGHATRAAMDL
ncbi:phospholipid phosphatase 6 [Crotalus adamanteus]|uniref:Phospholipid phosphatase 6 n=1 Tax=Crotalus adamanteus TaxID=8729 RepID=A0AAW1BNZ4_CROAD